MSAGQSTFFLLGASHHTTPLALREKLALGPDRLPDVRRQLAAVPGLREFAVLNTCNRVEFYGVADHRDTIDGLEQTFCRAQGLTPGEFALIRQEAVGPDAIRHLIEVAAGLDSQMLGENEIFGQVKEAYAAAQRAQTVGPVLNRVFQKSFQAAKAVRSHTALTAGHLSVANVAVDLAQTIFGDLRSSRVLLLGAGEIGEKTARAFQSRGAGALTVSSRTLERAMALASEFDAKALPFENFARHLGDYDIVVCATAAPGAIVTLPAVAAAMRQRPAAPLFLIDLALPRDVDPLVAKQPNVFVYNLDDLARIADENRAAREAEVAKARVIVGDKTDALWRTVAAHCGGTRLAPADAAPPDVEGSPSRA